MNCNQCYVTKLIFTATMKLTISKTSVLFFLNNPNKVNVTVAYLCDSKILCNVNGKFNSLIYKNIFNERRCGSTQMFTKVNGFATIHFEV